jgi:5'(3')-deoxyribonucleotidase
MDGVIVDFNSGIAKLDELQLNQFKGIYDEVPHIFSMMDPIPDAVDSVLYLINHFDVYILSSSPWENRTALNDKLDWIKKYFGENLRKKVIFSHNKHLNMGDYLIDDRTSNGAGDFKGTHIHFGSDKFPTWKEVINYLNYQKD